MKRKTWKTLMSKGNRLVLMIAGFFTCFSMFAGMPAVCNEPDSAYLFAYGTAKNNHRNGLHFAWSLDQMNWHGIGPEYGFVRSDFGNWGNQKRMLAPFLFQGPGGRWECVWGLNEKDAVFAHASSIDLVYWKPQSYPLAQEGTNCLLPEVSFDEGQGVYRITWLGDRNGENWYEVTTRDFKEYSEPKHIPSRESKRREILIGGQTELGTVHKVACEDIDGLIKAQELVAYKNKLYSETTKEDPVRFAGLETVKATLHLQPEQTTPISDMLLGIFFEDINYAADGGIYAELVQNRGFEYQPSDRGHDPEWNSSKSWSLNGTGATFSIDTLYPVHPNNKHYAVLNITTPGAGLVNEGFDGIPLKKGEKYDFSLFASLLNGKSGKIKVRLIGTDGTVYGEAVIKGISSGWKKYTATLTAAETVADARLEVIPEVTGRVGLDMISLFPRNTFKGRKNGLRADLAQVLADMKPCFVRFPGGCVAHGDGLGNIYRWQNTVGPLEARVPQRNLWGYHQTGGLGYFEYFQFCEDIGAEAVPVVAAGVPCQNSSMGGHGQQCGIPMCEMDNYIQELFDLVEFANGSTKTKWGKLRAEMGHPAPFNLKYLGIGNEDLISDVFEERYKMICEAFREKHPEIMVIGTVGPFSEGSDYVEGWRIATELNLPVVDEHYYQPPGWYIHNHDYYDRYDRSKSKVYLGEYAAHLPGRPVNIETALAEALHLISMERNGDIVYMSSYAPLLAKENHTQWNPDLIYFNNTEVKPTVGYYVQQLWGIHAGNEYISSRFALSENREDVRKRIAASVVRDESTGDLIIKMVNLLPVAVDLTLDTAGLDLAGKQMKKVVLQGKPDDKTARPEETVVPSAELDAATLAPYSLTLYRIYAK
ncbi:MAG: carbohydrate binding domain-containing protein [Tannerellaceae bacterium]|nr:carbohydrate binding domain-containing protein [Tannerellaceae bacterium]